MKHVSDVMPHSEGNLETWASNFKSKIGTNGAVLGYTAAQISTFEGYCTNIINAIQNAAAAKAAAKSANAAKKAAKKLNAGLLRAEIKRIKANSSYNTGIGNDLQIVVGMNNAFSTALVKPVLKAKVMGGFVRLTFVKGGVDGVRIYRKLKTITNFTFLVMATKSPYDDHIVLANPTVPETWEYMCYAVVNDQQVGQPSDIVSVVFGG
jgi:hypothetical protein